MVRNGIYPREPGNNGWRTDERRLKDGERGDTSFLRRGLMSTMRVRCGTSRVWNLPTINWLREDPLWIRGDKTFSSSSRFIRNWDQTHFPENIGSSFDRIRALISVRCSFLLQFYKISTKSKFQDNYVIMNHRLLEEQRSTSDTFIVPSPPPVTQNICTKFGRGGGFTSLSLLSRFSWYWQIVCSETTQSALSVLIVTCSFLRYLLHPPFGPCIIANFPILSYVCFIPQWKCNGCTMKSYFSSGFQTLIIIIRVHFESFEALQK